MKRPSVRECLGNLTTALLKSANETGLQQVTFRVSDWQRIRAMIDQSHEALNRKPGAARRFSDADRKRMADAPGTRLEVAQQFSCSWKTVALARHEFNSPKRKPGRKRKQSVS